MTTVEQLQGVRNGLIEIGFVRGPVYDAAVSQRTVCREQFSLLLPVGRALEHADLSTNLATLQGEPFVFFPAGL